MTESRADAEAAATAASLRAGAARARRLAQATLDTQAQEALEQLAAEYERKAELLEQAGVQAGRAGLSTKACAHASRMASVSSP
jgi:hypothetical protein